MTFSYLVSTAGHAQHQNDLNPHEIRNILQIIEDGAKEFGEEKVVGFASVSGADGCWSCDRHSFIELLALSDQPVASHHLGQYGIGNKDNNGGSIISLLCPTGLNFLLAWIAFMRMGYGVVFIAPQCSPSAINHLVKSSSSTHLVYHPMYADLAHSAKELDPETIIVGLSPRSAHETDKSDSSASNGVGKVNPEMVSHVFHTSGTSGNPKPIPHTHIGTVSVLPRRALPSYSSSPSTPSSSETTIPPFESAAFTTTPLFHGGVSDLLRAWMARSMIYFYPTSNTPITSENVVRAVEACNTPPPSLPGLSLDEYQLAERTERFRVGSFLSVPYILTVLSEDLDGPGMAMLRSMDLVSTGGAPLDTARGDLMVERGVRLVSRLGSSECGFLLSSHRDYETEKDWEWFRNDSAYSDALRFVPGESDGMLSGEKFEMVVTERWSSRTKTNRDDGSYATGDLYERHSTKKNVWRYVGKGDDVLVMSNGEKASPGPIESVLRSSPYLSDALVVGTDRPRLGLLLFPRLPLPRITDILDLISPLLVQANQTSPSFAQISKEMCLVVKKIGLLPKSSKGTVQRGLAYEVFRKEIERLYDNPIEKYAGEKRSLLEIEDCLHGLIMDVMGSSRKVVSLDRITDLFSWGVDSLMATRIRSGIHRNLNTGGHILPGNIVFEEPSMARLSQYIFNLQEGQDPSESSNSDSHRLMDDLVEKYGTFTPVGTINGQKSSKQDRGMTVLFTGVTGSLGSFLLEQLYQLPPEVVIKIVCLVRAEDDRAAETRIKDVLIPRGLEIDHQNLEIYAADLTKFELGLTGEVYTRLVGTVDTVIHSAWPVHFGSSLVSFEDNIKGTRNLLDLLLSAKSDSLRFYFCSSLASVLARPPPDGNILELPSDDPSTASPIGYSQSKWVTEKICRRANESEGLHGSVHVLRIGQLCGDTDRGRWNEKEGWPLLISTAQRTGCLPMLREDTLQTTSWLPVDLAARAIIEVVLGDQTDAALVYHIVHPTPINWNDVLDGLQNARLAFRRVSPLEWLEKVGASSEDDPSTQMLSIWQAAFGKDASVQAGAIVKSTNAQAASTTLRNVKPIDRRQIEMMVSAWRETGFLR